jgi:hypothetical protein
MNFLEVNPEVIVGLGEKTIFNQQDSQIIESLHIELEDWLGDDLMEIYPCFVITEFLEEGLTKMKFTGYEIVSMITTKNEYFDNNYSLDKNLPLFKWIKINGKSYIDDFGIDEKSKKLVLSEKVYHWLKGKFSISFLTVGMDDADDFLAEFIRQQEEKYGK